MRTRLNIVDFLSGGGEVDGIKFGEEWSGKVSQATICNCLMVYDKLIAITTGFAVGTVQKESDVWGAQFILARTKARLDIEFVEQDIVMRFWGQNQDAWELKNPTELFDIVQKFDIEHGGKLVVDNRVLCRNINSAFKDQMCA